MITGDISSGVKRPGREADHSPSSAEVKKVVLYLHSPLYLRGIVLIKNRNNFTLIFYFFGEENFFLLWWDGIF
jgi:hypothetical protein